MVAQVNHQDKEPLTFFFELQYVKLMVTYLSDDLKASIAHAVHLHAWNVVMQQLRHLCLGPLDVGVWGHQDVT